MKNLNYYKDFLNINENNVEEYLTDTNNKFIVFISDKAIGASDNLKDSFMNILMPRVANTEYEESIFKNLIEPLVKDMNNSYNQEEMDDSINEILNEMGKDPIYTIKRRVDII